MNPALRHSAAHVFVESIETPLPSDDDMHHLLRVLRLRDGELVSVSDGAGNWRLAELRSASLVPVGEVVSEPMERTVTIAAAIPKGDRLEWMVQKLTELGVSRLILIECARSVVRWDAARSSRQLERLQRVAREAAMQSRRVWLPVIEGPMPFSTLVAAGNLLVADPAGVDLSECSNPRIATMAIGPEGGFTEEELMLPSEVVSLGPLVLRVETAALVAAVRLST